MSKRIPRRVLSYDDLRGPARDFLARYNPSGDVPVPIEEIIDLSFRMDIIPVPGLHAIHDIDGFITSDFEAIYVDQYVYESRPGRYRFTLAHELAHKFLHADVLKRFSFRTIAEWKDHVRNLDETDRGWLEWQAYAWAGLVLVPPAPLQERFQRALARISKAGFRDAFVSDAARHIVAGDLARQFQVSTQVVEKRQEYDKLWNPGRDRP
jgi:Zn-dependent peptidase ImmA (M78 family)